MVNLQYILSGVDYLSSKIVNGGKMAYNSVLNFVDKGVL